ncbi:glucose 1-dehydrogenase [Croceicoccus ponticola]|uniref:Glucose 1-dehydrogenase n=1 Tax=Croceicoccus ponticola TaxID=2217664 RepID=A0A437GUF3_9SPHN|nr:glucose 1-dehydrogenase [Croceicoccus ponticola]RVQ65026.1 glucose 1-dehydrogenase [Croceicoccus ponticola]
MLRLEGKVAIITGAAQGMGEAHARRFVAEGAKVVLTDLNEKGGQALADGLGENALFVRHDVSVEDEWKRVVETAECKFGSVNILVNNAGIIGPLADAEALSLSDYNFVCSVNQTSVMLGMKAVIPSMLASGGGSIVNVSSISGIVAIVGTPNLAYAASKFAIRGMTKQVAVEYGMKGIRVNSVHPGYIRTPMMVAATDEDGGGAAAAIPLGRFGEPEEVANLVVFLASDESSFITATEHIIDGGMTAI